MSSGNARAFRGSVEGLTATDLDVTHIGFRPTKVKVVNVTSGDEAFWQEGMADASAFKRIAAGTGALITTLGITPLANGFRLGQDADLNVIAEVIQFEAWD